MKKQTLFLVLLLLVLTGSIGIVSASTETGSFSSEAVTQENISVPYGGGMTTLTPDSVYIKDTSLLGTLQTILVIGQPGMTSVILRDGGTYYSGQTPFTSELGSGIIGYQEVYDNNGGFLFEYGYIIYDTFVASGPVSRWDNLTYNHTAVHNFKFQTSYAISAISSPPTHGAWFGNSYMATPSIVAYITGGSYGMGVFNNIYYPFHNTYSASSGIGNLSVSGTIIKNVSGVSYGSKGFVYNATSGAAIASESTATSTNWNFSVFQGNIKIGVIDANNVSYNSSTLFTSAIPTPTPTPTPTVTLGPGQFWLTFSAEDATTGGLIPGAEIDIYSEFAGTWNNATTTSGERTIATSQNHIFDAYGSASGYVNGSALDKIAYPNQNYLVKLFPTTGLPNVPGYVNLFVSVTERETGSPISGVSVTVNTPGSFTVTGETDNTGSEVFSTSNSSVKYITVSKSGYKSETRTITTPASGNYNAALQMSRVLVTTQPTSYIPPGGVTPQITVDPRSSTEKDQDMMNMVRDAGPNLIQLAIVVTMISLLGLMTKGFGK